MEICPICHREVIGPKCPGSALSKLWVLAEYREPLVENLIRYLKYEYLTDLVDVWSLYLNNFWSKFSGEINCRRTLLVPVPLHSRRLLERGFNQASLIAHELSEISGLAVVEDLLVRSKYTEPQVGLTSDKRGKNVRGIFEVNYCAISDCWGKEIILLDDVYTTGSTISECARALQGAGFGRISALTLAIG